MAQALQMRAGFVCEFMELESVVRSPRDQGGGVHGNAIFTRYDAEFRVLEHKHQPVNWEREGMALREPRKGERYTLVAEINVYPNEAPILCYCVHLEVFCGISGRIAQFSDVLADATMHRRTHPRQLICGDLNTMAHSIARLSSRYCRDKYRWRSLGYTEAEWWDRYLFAWHCEDGPRNELLARQGVFSEQVLRAARNPGFWDPWDTLHDVTLNNKSYYGLYQAKLDWTLLMGWDLDAKRMGNHDYSASDHKWLLLDIVPEHDDDDDDDSEQEDNQSINKQDLSGRQILAQEEAAASSNRTDAESYVAHDSISDVEGPAINEVLLSRRVSNRRAEREAKRIARELELFRKRRQAANPRPTSLGLRLLVGASVAAVLIALLRH
jgi:hypothetical protein